MRCVGSDCILQIQAFTHNLLSKYRTTGLGITTFSLTCAYYSTPSGISSTLMVCHEGLELRPPILVLIDGGERVGVVERVGPPRL